MVAKGIIQSIDYASNTCTVRIPIFESSANDKEIVVPATISIQPGIYNGYVAGDVVIVGFENNIVDNPVVLGKLYLGINEELKAPRGAINCTNFSASSPISIPIDTKLTLNNNQKNLSTVGVDGDLSCYKTIADIARQVRKQDEQIGTTNIKLIDNGIELGAKVDKENDGKTHGFGWHLTDEGWTISSYDSSHLGIKDIDIFHVDNGGVTICGDVKITGYPTKTVILYAQNSSTSSAPAFPADNDTTTIFPDNFPNTMPEGYGLTELNPTGWSTLEPERAPGKYIWQKTIVFSYDYSPETYGDKLLHEKRESTTICISGADGKNGDSGKYVVGTQDWFKLIPDDTEEEDLDDELDVDWTYIKNYENHKYIVGQATVVTDPTIDPDVIIITDPWQPNIPETTVETESVSQPIEWWNSELQSLANNGGSKYIKNGNTLYRVTLDNFDSLVSQNIIHIIQLPPTSAAIGGGGGHQLDPLYIGETVDDTNIIDATKNWVTVCPAELPGYTLWTRTETIYNTYQNELVEDEESDYNPIEVEDAMFSKPTVNTIYKLVQGKSTNYYSDTDPAETYIMRDGDCWFDTGYSLVTDLDDSSEKYYIVQDNAGEYFGLTGTNEYASTVIRLIKYTSGLAEDRYNVEKAATTNTGSGSGLAYNLYKTGTLQQWNNGAWHDIGSELVTNKLTANYINALDITAKKIKVLDEDNNTLFEANDENKNVKIAGFKVDGTTLANSDNFILLSSNTKQIKQKESLNVISADYLFAGTSGNSLYYIPEEYVFYKTARSGEFKLTLQVTENCFELSTFGLWLYAYQAPNATSIDDNWNQVYINNDQVVIQYTGQWQPWNAFRPNDTQTIYAFQYVPLGTLCANDTIEITGTAVDNITWFIAYKQQNDFKENAPIALKIGETFSVDCSGKVSLSNAAEFSFGDVVDGAYTEIKNNTLTAYKAEIYQAQIESANIVNATLTGTKKLTFGTGTKAISLEKIASSQDTTYTYNISINSITNNDWDCDNTTGAVYLKNGRLILTATANNSSDASVLNGATVQHIRLYIKYSSAIETEAGMILSSKTSTAMPLIMGSNFTPWQRNGNTNVLTATLNSDTTLFQIMSSNTIVSIRDISLLGPVYNYTVSTSSDLALSIDKDFVPAANGSLNLGLSGYRWSKVYAVDGTIDTSDRKEKNSISYDLSNYDKFFDDLKPASFKFNTTHFNRTHLGLIAQDIQESLFKNNLTRKDFGGLVLGGDGFDPEADAILDEEKTNYGIGYAELHALEIYEIQKLKQQVKDLQEELIALKDKE